MQTQYDSTEILDTQGLYCPEPIMMLHSKMDELSVGAQLLIIATDPATKRDIPKFCQFLGHKLLKQQESDQSFQYLIEKA
ncbi:MAG: sulfurtransferase TusA [Oleiphilus sp.]